MAEVDFLNVEETIEYTVENVYSLKFRFKSNFESLKLMFCLKEVVEYKMIAA